MAGLRIPARAVTNGVADPEWVDVPVTTWRLWRRPSQRLPLDPRAARSVRRWVRLEPWFLLVFVVWLAAPSVADLAGLPSAGRRAITMTTSIALLLWPLVQSPVPQQLPFRTRFGDLRIPRVPIEVAAEWTEQNPGVIATDQPAPRAHSPRFYAGWSRGLLLAAIGLFAVLANNNREDNVVLWLLVPASFVASMALAMKIEPPATLGSGPLGPS